MVSTNLEPDIVIVDEKSKGQQNSYLYVPQSTTSTNSSNASQINMQILKPTSGLTPQLCVLLKWALEELSTLTSYYICTARKNLTCFWVFQGLSPLLQHHMCFRTFYCFVCFSYADNKWSLYISTICSSISTTSAKKTQIEDTQRLEGTGK